MDFEKRIADRHSQTIQKNKAKQIAELSRQRHNEERLTRQAYEREQKLMLQKQIAQRLREDAVKAAPFFNPEKSAGKFEKRSDMSTKNTRNSLSKFMLQKIGIERREYTTKETVDLWIIIEHPTETDIQYDRCQDTITGKKTHYYKSGIGVDESGLIVSYVHRYHVTEANFSYPGIRSVVPISDDILVPLNGLEADFEGDIEQIPLVQSFEQKLLNLI